MDELGCLGHEGSLADCWHDGWGVSNCQHSEDVAISCGTPTEPAESTTPPSTGSGEQVTTAATPETITARLVGGVLNAEGFIEIQKNGTWIALCPDHFELYIAEYICTSLDHHETPSFILKEAPITNISERIWKINSSCSAKTNDLGTCFNLSPTNTCASESRVYLKCLSSRIRLVGGPSSREGRVEVYNSGRWGSVCDNTYDSRIAQVTCRSLAYNGSYELLTGLYPGEQPYTMGGLQCIGTEYELFDCTVDTSFDGRVCSRMLDVAVRCSFIPSVSTSVPLRLVEGTSDYDGRLEVKINNVWGTICNDRFDEVDASVACYMLGFGRAGATISRRENTHSMDSPIWLDELDCLGREESIMDCPHDGIGNHNCEHSEDVFINCSRTSSACPPGWRGQGCTERVNYCFGDPCENNATCVSGATGPLCLCPQVTVHG
jgi:deleted-in-malignant-brain-tumors protein 1